MSPPEVSLRLRHRGRLGWAAVALVVAAAAGGAVWYAANPAELPTTDDPVAASTPARVPVYVGAFVPPDDFDRTLHLSGVKVQARSGAPITVLPLLCRGGAVAVTSDPGPFCDQLLDPEGAELRRGDSIMLEVRGDAPTVAVIDRIRVAYRDGLQWATQEAGAPVSLTVLPG